MNSHRLETFRGGWFVGAFQPRLIASDHIEVAVKRYAAGDAEGRHVHRIATELTLIASGKVRMNGVVWTQGDILEILPGESTDFLALEDTITVVVKTPSAPDDKYPG
ncbi:MAG: hypothetical protein IPN71_15120 [Fibrobacteres bacterium]|jgi:hypothetical protein|nr:hypothetical protein [Fibrobacterota bacterium]